MLLYYNIVLNKGIAKMWVLCSLRDGKLGHLSQGNTEMKNIAISPTLMPEMK